MRRIVIFPTTVASQNGSVLTFIDTFHSWFEYEGRDAEYTEKYDVTIFLSKTSVW